MSILNGHVVVMKGYHYHTGLLYRLLGGLSEDYPPKLLMYT